jgi:hypothetical protein
METLEKNWYVNIDGTIHEASGETVDKWIWDGTLLSHHTISRGGQRWLEAARVPQFSRLFAAPIDAAEIGPGMPEAHSPTDPQTLSGEDLPTPLGVKISMGSAIALAVALVAGYFWAFQITSPPERAAFTESPEMRALQIKYDMEKKRIEDIQISLKANAGPAPAQELSNRPQADPQMQDKWRAAQEASLKKVKTADRDPLRFDMNGQAITSVDKSFETLDLKLEADQKQTVTDLQKADTRSRFYRTFVLLFLALAGLNIVRITLFSGKNAK